MTKEQIPFSQVKDTFNNIHIARGELVTIATCDDQGHPNLAPIGSMRVVNEETVHVLQGLLPRTSQNLKLNPRAAFSVLAPSKLSDLWTLMRSNDPMGEGPLGYRIYGELVGIDDNRTAVLEEMQHILPRIPWLFRQGFLRFAEKNLRRLMKFKILEVRAT